MRTLLAAIFFTAGMLSAAHPQSTPAPSGPKFIEINKGALLGSRLIGLPVLNAAGEDLGKIEDVALEAGELVGVVLSVGQSPRLVAVDPSSISIKYAEGEHRWRATLNASIDQLKSAPEFLYEGKWKR